MAQSLLGLITSSPMHHHLAEQPVLPAKPLCNACFYPPLSLTASSTCSLYSTLTNTIHITQNVPLPTMAINKEPKEACIKVTDKGVFSDYDETEGQEQEKALASGTKHSVCASSLVSHIHIFWSILALPLFTRTVVIRTNLSQHCGRR